MKIRSLDSAISIGANKAMQSYLLLRAPPDHELADLVEALSGT